jgi:hypothetical protein
MEPRQPWERLERETAKAFSAFSLYRDAGPSRSITATAKALGKGRTVISNWSQVHSWVQRATEYDLWLDAERLKAVRDAAIQEHQQRMRSLPRQQLREADEITELVGQLQEIIAENLQRLQDSRHPLSPGEIASLGRFMLNAIEVKNKSSYEALGIEKLIAEFLDRQK